MSEHWQEIRCPSCNRRLFDISHQAIVGELAIKCPGCKTVMCFRSVLLPYNGTDYQGDGNGIDYRVWGTGNLD